MVNKKYEKVVAKHKPKETRVKNAFVAFVVGGLVGVIGEALIQLFCHKYHISRSEASIFMMIILIFIAITGFAHSMTSAAIDYRKEGPIFGIGSNIFKLAGSVILYGVVAAWFFGMIRLLIGGGV